MNVYFLVKANDSVVIVLSRLEFEAVHTAFFLIQCVWMAQYYTFIPLFYATLAVLNPFALAGSKCLYLLNYWVNGVRLCEMKPFRYVSASLYLRLFKVLVVKDMILDAKCVGR